jgi:hypothetical protein
MSHDKGRTMKHEQRKSQHVKTNQGFWPALVVAGQTTEPCCPGKTARNNPPTRQHDDAARRLWQCDNLHMSPLGIGRLCRLLAGVPLIHESDLDMGVRDFLDSHRPRDAQRVASKQAIKRTDTERKVEEYRYNGMTQENIIGEKSRRSVGGPA